MKTLKLIEQTLTLLEQSLDGTEEQPPMEGGQPQDIQDVTQPEQAPEAERSLTMTSEGEDEYISLVIDAALFEPSTISSEERQTLLSLQDVMLNKTATGVSNAREEVLPIVLQIISKETQDKGLKKELSKI